MDDDKIININIELNVTQLRRVVDEAAKLNDNDEIFKTLASYATSKAELEAALDEVKSAEAEIKAAINSKAKELEGDAWAAIAGEGYKITRSATGSVYDIAPDGKPPKQFLVIKQSINTKAVETYVKEKGKLPKDVVPNPARGESLRVSVKAADNDNS